LSQVSYLILIFTGVEKFQKIHVLTLVMHFATPKSDEDVIWIQKKSFLCMGSHFMNPGPSSQKLKAGGQDYFYF